MKLCRFELKNGELGARTGIVYSGKIYETDGANSVGVHEPQDIRLLPPIAPSSVRIFRSVNSASNSSLPPRIALPFSYIHPKNVAGSYSYVTIPIESGPIYVESYLGVIAASDFHRASEDVVEDAILGYGIFALFVDSSLESQSPTVGAFDFAPVFGPVLMTTDELEERRQDKTSGVTFDIPFNIKVNQVEKARGSTIDFQYGVAEILAMAGESAPVFSGDLFAIGSTASTANTGQPLEVFDEISITAEGLGTLTVKLVPEGYEEGQV